jgi:hypothetical protein
MTLTFDSTRLVAKLAAAREMAQPEITALLPGTALATLLGAGYLDPEEGETGFIDPEEVITEPESMAMLTYVGILQVYDWVLDEEANHCSSAGGLDCEDHGGGRPLPEHVRHPTRRRHHPLQYGVPLPIQPRPLSTWRTRPRYRSKNWRRRSGCKSRASGRRAARVSEQSGLIPADPRDRRTPRSTARMSPMPCATWPPNAATRPPGGKAGGPRPGGLRRRPGPGGGPGCQRRGGGNA